MKLPNSTPAPSDLITDAASTVSNNNRKTITVFVDETDTISPFIKTYKNELEVVQKIEKLIRSSFEYRQYVSICKTEFDLTRCKFIPDADLVDGNISLELHHYPFTLFDLTQAALRYEYGELDESLGVYKEDINIFRIAEHVMKLHYQGVVGLIPLSLTAHELAHNGDIFIPLTEDYVFGSWKELYENQAEYEMELDDIVSRNIETAMKMTQDLIESGEEVDLSVLEPIKTKVVHSSFSETPNYIVTAEDNFNLAWQLLIVNF